METQPKLQDLRAFCQVVDQGSITAAARTLGETKGSVSRRIARIEETLGAALIQRVGGRAQPTADGLVYRKQAGEALELLDAAAADLRDLEASPKGHLRVTALPGVGADMLGTVIGRFIGRFPDVSVEMLLTENVLSFRDDRIDFAFRPAVDRLPDSGHIAHLLTEVCLRLVASPEYLAEHGTPSHPRELAEHRLLVPPARGGGFPIWLQPRGRPAQARQFDLRGHVLSHDTRFLHEVALAGGGITVAMRVADEPRSASGPLLPVLRGWEPARRSRLYLLHPAGALTPKARAFRDFVTAEFRRRKGRRSR